MRTVTLHRRADGDPDSARIVADGFRWSVFLLPPAALLVRGLWVAFFAWLLFACAIVGAAAAGALSAGSALVALLIVHFVLAIDTPDLERRRLQRRGWLPVALSGPFGTASFAAPGASEVTSAAPAGIAVPAVHADVIGLFPDRPR